MKYTNIKKLLIKFFGGGLISFPTRILRWVIIEGDSDGSDDGGGDGGGGQVEMIRINKEAFPVNNQDILLPSVDKTKGYTLDEIFDKGADVVQMLIDLFKANVTNAEERGQWENMFDIALSYQGNWGVKDWGKAELPKIRIEAVSKQGTRYPNKASLNLYTESAGGSAPAIQIYFEEGADGKWYMYDGWSVTAQ